MATSLLGVGPGPARPSIPTPDRRIVAAVPAVAVLDPAKIAPDGAVALHLVSQLVPCHRREQLEQLLGRLQLVLPQGGADEEAGQHRLADVHRVEKPVQPGVHQPDAAQPGGSLARTAARAPPPPARPRPERDGAAPGSLHSPSGESPIAHEPFASQPDRADRLSRTEPSTSDYGDHRHLCRTDPILTQRPKPGPEPK